MTAYRPARGTSPNHHRFESTGLRFSLGEERSWLARAFVRNVPAWLTRGIIFAGSAFAVTFVLLPDTDMSLPLLFALIAMLGYTQRRTVSVAILGLALVTITVGVLAEVVASPANLKDWLLRTFGLLAFWLITQFSLAQQHRLDELSRVSTELGLRVYESAKSRDQAERRARELDALYRADIYLFRSLQLREIVKALANVVTNVLGADKCSVWMWDSKQKCLTVEATSGFAPKAVPPVLAASSGSIVNQVFSTGEPIVMSDLAVDSGSTPEISGTERLCSGLAIPITTGKRVVGVFGVYYCQPRAFTPDDVRLFASFAQRVAQAIENARLYARAQQSATIAERQRLAGDLHDSLVQSLFGVTMLADAGRRQAGTGNLALAQACLTRIVEATQRAARDLRLLVHDLRPLALERERLVGALQLRLDAVERRVGVDARIVADGVDDLPPIVEDCLYRIALQALDNSLKHAHATSVQIDLCADATTVELIVADNGAGFVPQCVSDRGGFGLATMRERAERLGGQATVESQPDRGTRVLVRLPI